MRRSRDALRRRAGPAGGGQRYRCAAACHHPQRAGGRPGAEDPGCAGAGGCPLAVQLSRDASAGGGARAAAASARREAWGQRGGGPAALGVPDPGAARHCRSGGRLAAAGHRLPGRPPADDAGRRPAVAADRHGGSTGPLQRYSGAGKPLLPAAAAAGDDAPLALSKPDHTAYIIFTSGSTGRPKGVMVGQTAIVNRLLWMQDRYPLSADDVVAQKTPCSFDVSVWEFWWPFIAGAQLVMAEPEAHRDPQAMQQFFARYGVTTTHFVPSMLAAFVASLDADSVAACRTLRRVFCSGEALPTELCREWERLTGARCITCTARRRRRWTSAGTRPADLSWRR
ncbi:hypothetical protein CJ738_04305 [Klebsiella pneumoniae]|nr:hypothetical protein CJ738_04305 [Klebsiella pneumoniae]